jgi:Reverse transcriptase (RNA-dependent DNA polymerase)
MGIDCSTIGCESSILAWRFERDYIYMECPDGLISTGDKVVVLNKSMYGLVQAARQLFLKFKTVLEAAEFKQSKAEP